MVSPVIHLDKRGFYKQYSGSTIQITDVSILPVSHCPSQKPFTNQNMKRTDEKEIYSAQRIVILDKSSHPNGLALCASIRRITLQQYMKCQMLVRFAENNLLLALFFYHPANPPPP
jgi:hypothetical protein